MPWIKCQVNFSVSDPRGWIIGCDLSTGLDPSVPLEGQARNAATDWIDTRNRVHGTDLRLSHVLSVFVEHEGFWYASFAREGCEVAWPIGVPNTVKP